MPMTKSTSEEKQLGPCRMDYWAGIFGRELESRFRTKAVVFMGPRMTRCAERNQIGFRIIAS